MKILPGQFVQELQTREVFKITTVIPITGKISVGCHRVWSYGQSTSSNTNSMINNKHYFRILYKTWNHPQDIFLVNDVTIRRLRKIIAREIISLVEYCMKYSHHQHVLKADIKTLINILNSVKI